MTSAPTISTNDGFSLKLAGIVALAALGAFFGVGIVRDVLAQWDLGQSANPYIILSHAFSLYVAVPLVSLACSIFFLAPGLIIATVTGREKALAHWLLAGFGLSIVVLTAATSAFQIATGIVLTGHRFFALVAIVNLVLLVLAGLRLASGQRFRINLRDQGTDLWMSLGLFLAVLILMSPKFYWENFTGDGSGALQFTRLFVHTLWPFWPDDAGVIKQAPGLTSFLFVVPDSWFVRLWGETEYSVRVGHLMGLGLLYPVLTALIRTGRPEARIGIVDHLLLAATLYLYSLSVIYSGGYHAWFGDSPMPAVRETLAMVCFMGYILAFVEDRRAMMVGLGVMSHLSIPTGGLWLLLWPIAVWLVWRPRPWPQLRTAVLTLVIAAAISIALPVAISSANMPFPGDEFSAKAIVDRLRFVSIIDWARFGYLAIPIGLTPALFLFTWSWQDRLSRALTLLTAVFFLFFYFQGYRVLLHHFIPAMFPPLVVMWRSPLMRDRFTRGAVVAGLLAALVIAWPRQMGMHDHDRAFAAFIQTEGPRFDSAAPLDGERFRGFEPKALDTFHHLFDVLLPIGYGERDAGERFFGAPLVWFYYSEFPKPEGQVINYVVKPIADATPEDGELFDSYDGYGLYIKDMALFEQQRNQKLPINTGSWALHTPREIMFGHGAKWPPNWKERMIIDLVPIAKRLLGIHEAPQSGSTDPATGQTTP
jgi:hypothetical protein